MVAELPHWLEGTMVPHPAQKATKGLGESTQAATRPVSQRLRLIKRRIESFFRTIDLYLENGIIKEGDPEWRIKRILEEKDEESRIDKFEQASHIARYIRDRLSGRNPPFAGDENLELAELVLSDFRRSDWLIAHYGELEELRNRYVAFVKGVKGGPRKNAESRSDRSTADLIEEIFDVKSDFFAAFIGREFVANQFEEVLPLPRTAPAAWKSEKQKGETPAAFIRRVYGEWEGKGLTKNLIRQLDPALYRALYNWTSRGNEMPPDFDLPSLQEQNDRTVAEIVLGRDSPAMAVVREGRRIESVLRRRFQER